MNYNYLKHLTSTDTTNHLICSAKNSNFKILFGISLALVMFLGSTPLGFSDSLRDQLDQGTIIEELQCQNSSHVLVLRTNGNLACVSEPSAEKLNWTLVSKIQNIVSLNENLGLSESVSESGNVDVYQIPVASSVEFVDDGREIQRSVLQRAPAPIPMYDVITSSNTEAFSVGTTGFATVQSSSHEKYSKNIGIGLYAEDWIPDFIPDGYRLLYTNTSCYEQTDCSLGLFFVPTSFELHQDITSYDLEVSKGFGVGIRIADTPLDETEDIIEELRETRESQSGNYGGFTDMTRDGKTVMAYEGGNDYNHYQAVVSFHPDEYSSVYVNSNYHTLEELIPIFNSVMR